MKENLKTIKIKPETHKKLGKLGKKGDSFDHIINKLVEYFKKNK